MAESIKLKVVDEEEEEEEDFSSVCRHVDIFPVDINDLSESCEVCTVQWSEDTEVDHRSYFRVGVESPDPETQLKVSMDIARAMLRKNCGSLQQFIHTMFRDFEGRLSKVDLDAKSGHVYLSFRTHPDKVNKYKELFDQYNAVLTNFLKLFSPAWFREQKYGSYTCVCQILPFGAEKPREDTSAEALPSQSGTITQPKVSGQNIEPGTPEGSSLTGQVLTQGVSSSNPQGEVTPQRVSVPARPRGRWHSRANGAGERSQAESYTLGTTETATSGESETDDEDFDSADGPALQEASRRIRELEESVTAGSDRMKSMAMDIASSIQGLWLMVQQHRERQQQSPVLHLNLQHQGEPYLGTHDGVPAVLFAQKQSPARASIEQPPAQHQSAPREFGDEDVASNTNTYTRALDEAGQVESEDTKCKVAPAPDAHHVTSLPRDGGGPSRDARGPSEGNTAHPGVPVPVEGAWGGSSPRPPDVRPKTTSRRGQMNLFDHQAPALKEEAEACLQQLGVSESEVLIYSLMRALFEESSDTPRAKTLDTILVLDCSDSMQGKPLEIMKKTALDFLAGIESVAEESGLEENIAVVTMGNGATVVQHLTNDYERVQRAIESLTANGLSPLFEAMCVAVAEARKKGGVVNASGCHRIAPRVILFTDGHATHETQEGGHDLGPPDANVRVRIVRLVQHIDKRSSGPRPLIWVPIGDNVSPLLKTLATICKGSGMLVSTSEIRSLCSYYLEQDAVGKVFSCAKHIGESREQVEAVIPALVENLSPEQRTRVVDAVMEKIAVKDPKSNGKASDWDNIREQPDLPPLGTRVIRGPDWKWQNQDTEGPGTVINHDENKNLVWVTWDNGSTNCYRCGFDNAYDILNVDVIKYPRHKTPGEMIDIGYTVVRGPDWDKQEQDGGEGNLGIVIRKRDDGKVKVRWMQTGHTDSYRFGKDGKYDLRICFPTEPIEMRNEFGASGFTGPGDFNSPLHHYERFPDSEDTGIPVWQWKDGSSWRDFPPDITEQIEKACIKGGRTCIVTHNAAPYRILINKKQARPSDITTGLPSYELKRTLK